MKVRVAEEDPLFLRVFFVLSFFLELTKHFIDQVLIFFGHANLYNSLEDTLKQGILIDFLQVEL